MGLANLFFVGDDPRTDTPHSDVSVMCIEVSTQVVSYSCARESHSDEYQSTQTNSGLILWLTKQSNVTTQVRLAA